MRIGPAGVLPASVRRDPRGPPGGPGPATRSREGATIAAVARLAWMVYRALTGCDPGIVTGSHTGDGPWLAADDGSTGEVALLPR